LLELPQALAATKRDALTEPDPLPRLAEEAARLGLTVVPVSAVTGFGLVELKRVLAALLPPVEPETETEASAVEDLL
jgi:50S ribosomal subunit-associated GTPase HflX